jgi:hypothetical protein
VGAKFARRRQRGGLYSRRFGLSTPYFHFSLQSEVHLIEPEFENLKPKFLLDFSGLLPCPPPFGAALFSDDGVIGATHFPVNPPKRQKRHFPFLADRAVWKTRLNYQ